MTKITTPIVGKQAYCSYCLKPVKVTLDGRAKRHGIQRIRYALRDAVGRIRGWHQEDKGHCIGTGEAVKFFSEDTK